MDFKALAEIGRWLRRERYQFTTITPESHRRVNARPQSDEAKSLRDVFGWTRPFTAATVGSTCMTLLERADALESDGTFFKSRVRFSTYGTCIFAHSAFPCLAADSVFFGPDTYRFLRAIDEAITHDRPPDRIVDIGAGSGAAGIRLAQLYPASEVVLGDINELALNFARANATLNGCINVDVCQSDVLQNVAGRFDLIVSNPPYLVDAAARVYRHGGGALGHDLALRILADSMPHLSANGRLLLYTGSAIIDGRDIFRDKCEAIIARGAATYAYDELDPDVFGEELEGPAYAGADRIAAVLLSVSAPPS